MSVNFADVGLHLLQTLPYILGLIVLPQIYVLLMNVVERPLHNALELQALEGRNNASGVNFAGALLGLGIAVTLGPLSGGEDRSYASGLGAFYLSGLTTILAFIVFHHVLDKVVLRLENNAEAISNGNMAAAITEACGYVALGLIVSGSFAGDGQGFWAGIASAILFTFLGTLILVAVYTCYTLAWKQFRVDVDAKIAEGDMPSAWDAGSVLIAIAVTLYYSIAGDFTGWIDDLVLFGIGVLSSTILVFVGRFIAGKLLAKTFRRASSLGRSLALGAVTIGIGVVAGSLI